MRRFSIGRTLRVALLALALVLAVIAALGVAGLYDARQRYEDVLARSSSLATAAANLTSAGVDEEQALREARGRRGSAVRARAAAAYRTAADTATTLASEDGVSERLIRAQIAAQARARALAARGRLDLATATSGPLTRARALAAQVQARQHARQTAARSTARSRSRRAVIIVAVAGVLALVAALALITALVAGMRKPLDELVLATRELAAGKLDRRVHPAGPRELQDLGLAFNRMGEELEEARRRTEEQLREKARLEQAKTDFVATASHELRSPLTSIKGFVELLQRSPGDMSPRQREFVAIILRSTDRLVELVNDLLDVARIEADRVEINRRATDLGEVAREVAELMRPQIDDKQQDLEVFVAPGVAPAFADPARVRQIVANLLTNAHLYTPSGGHIRIGVDADRAWVKLTVADTGVGMTEEQSTRVFERFYRGRSDGGTGLGLSIVKSLVDLHNGRIDVESQPDQGTSFTVLLPAARPSPELGAIEAIRGCRVLVVDDERDVAELIAGQLAPLEVSCDIALNGEDALARLRNGGYDALTLDILMPGMDGFEMLRRIRSDPDLGSLPILFVSVFAGRADLAGEWTVSKPIDADELRQVLAAAVTAGRSRVLVVGRESVRTVLDPALDELGIEREWVSTGTQAAERCTDRRFEVALVDAGLPELRSVLESLDLRGRRLRRAVILFSDGVVPLPPGIDRLGLEVVPARQAGPALLATLHSHGPVSKGG